MDGRDTKLNQRTTVERDICYVGAFSVQWFCSSDTATVTFWKPNLAVFNLSRLVTLFVALCCRNRQDYVSIQSRYVALSYCFVSMYTCLWLYFITEHTLLIYFSISYLHEIVEKCRCDLRQQMSRSNNGLVSLSFLVCLCGNICTVLCVFFGPATMGSGRLI